MKKINKSAFVRGLPATMPAAEVVSVAKSKGIKLTVKFVHTIRYNAKLAARKKGKATGVSIAVRDKGKFIGPANGSRKPAPPPAMGLVAEIEAIVERKLNAILKARLGAVLA